jgi:hypothetical protein
MNLQCGNCGQLMAVDPDHLGREVECPHCQHIVQAPPAADVTVTPPAPASWEPVFNVPSAAQREDIFTPLDEASGDDVFGTTPSRPVVEMPPEPGAAGTTEMLEPSPVEWEPAPPAPPVDSTVTFMTADQAPPAPMEFPAAAGPLAADADHPSAESLPSTPRPPRRPATSSTLGPLLMIFLIPYALVTTGYIAWHLYNQNKATFDPLERLPDPKPGNGGARRISPHSPLPTKLKTSLGQPLRVGDLEVTPLSVQRSADGLLTLHLKLRNVSQDVVFKPVLPNDAYLKNNNKLDTGPYTYLHAGSKRLYGLGPEWDTKPPRKDDDPFEGTLRPGEEMTVVFRSRQDDRREVAQAAAADQGSLVWRVQLRRGLVAVRDTEVSATAVIGVEFDPQAISAEPGEAARQAPRRGSRQSPLGG